MNNKDYIFLWAQWGILNYDQYLFLIRKFGSLDSAWENVDSKFLSEIGFDSKKIERVLYLKNNIEYQRYVNLDYKIISISSNDYPKSLKNINNPPVFLFVLGNIPVLHKAISIVGARKISDYGTYVTEKITKDLVLNNFVIVSGLALGVDTCAHKICLANGGLTIAVLGSGIDRIYPAYNQYLAKEIVKKGGAIISEYPIGTPAMPYHFPMRNRIVSALSRGTIVAEAGIKSGALITARYALEQGKEVFAIPNNINKQDLSGTNHLIKKGEAKLIESIEDVLSEFQMKNITKPRVISFSLIESELLEMIMNEGKTIDELTSITKYNVAKLSEVFIGLQLKGVARQINQKWVIV